MPYRKAEEGTFLLENLTCPEDRAHDFHSVDYLISISKEEPRKEFNGWNIDRAIAGLGAKRTMRPAEPFQLLQVLNMELQGVTYKEGFDDISARTLVFISPFAFSPIRTTLHELAHVYHRHVEFKITHQYLSNTPAGGKIVQDQETIAEATSLLGSWMLGVPGKLTGMSRTYLREILNDTKVPRLMWPGIVEGAEAIIAAGK